MSSYSIDLQCPQCGAPVVLDETERIVACEYCRVRHIIISGKHQTYCIPPRQETSPDALLYIPYWRFKGMSFALQDAQVRHRLMDSSAQAVEHAGIPFSLGLRSQTQHLQQVTSASPGRFLIPALSGKVLLERMIEHGLGFGAEGHSTLQLQAHVGEVVSLIYSPVLVGSQTLSDGITGRSYSGQALSLAQEPVSPEPPASMSFLPVLCPHCGWDLAGETKSLCLRCTNCCSLWIGYKGRLIEIPFQFYGSSLHEQSYLPFWQFKVSVPDQSGNTFLSILQPFMDEGSDQAFMVPAFKIHPGLFLRLSRQMTPGSASGLNPDKFPRAAYYPATLPFRESFQFLPILLSRMVRNTQQLAEDLSQATLKPRQVKLVFVPFHSRGSDLVQPEKNIGLHKNALSIGRLF